MLNALLNSPKISVLEKALSASSLRNKVISNNIANVNTPDFKKSEVSFEEQLEGAMNNSKISVAKTHERHFPIKLHSIEPSINTITTTSLRSDGNNVDIDVEMANLAKNSIYYDAVAQQISKYFAGIKSAINEGKR